jgi:hypothetical protein
MLIIALAACHGPAADSSPGDSDPVRETDDTDVAPTYALDDMLEFQHVQMKGTHNSYHIAKDNAPPDLDYTFAPLTEQFEHQDVRHIELDVDNDGTGFHVEHITFIDPGTTCELLSDCLGETVAWSAAHPGHAPIVVMIEVKQTYIASTAQAFIDGLEAELAADIPEDQRITPDMVQGDAESLNAAVRDGWPTLGELRGKILVVMDGDDFRPLYTANDTTTAGKIMFMLGKKEYDNPVIAIELLNDPIGDAADITLAQAAGHLVRTRADADNEEPLAGDYTRAEAALASGAQLISTDYPVPVDGVDYVFDLPEGGPVRCNPVTAPDECTTLAIENPALLQ